MREEYAVSETVLPAGLYWVGDPCYAFDDQAVWMALLESAGIEANPTPRIMEADAKGRSFVASGTAYGDGTYFDEHGNEYGVDAGLIGVTPVVAGQQTPAGMREVRFDGPFSVEYSDGTIKVGDIEIDTDPEPEADECLRCGTEVEGEEYCDSCESYLEGQGV